MIASIALQGQGAQCLGEGVRAQPWCLLELRALMRLPGDGGRGQRGGQRTEARRWSTLPARRNMKKTKREEEQRRTQHPCTPGQRVSGLGGQQLGAWP